MSEPTGGRWPELDYDAIAATVDHIHRLAQLAGKYTLDEPYEPNWGNITLAVTPRGFSTPTLCTDDGVFFAIEFALLDDRVSVTASNGRTSLALGPGSVSDFYAAFTEAVAPLGIPAPRTRTEVEISAAHTFDQDTITREYDPSAAHAVWAALAHASAALSAWQAPFTGHRPRTGVMWGGFDLSATRYNGRALPAPQAGPMFLRNGSTAEVVAVGFSFGDEQSRTPAFYAYLSPSPAGMADADFGVAEAGWIPQAGVAALPWAAVAAADDPHDTVLRFADAVYDIAVERGGWPDHLVGRRHDGWYASHHPVPNPN